MMQKDDKEIDTVLAALGVASITVILAQHENDAHEAGLLEVERVNEAGYRLRVGELLRAAERISSLQLEEALAEQSLGNSKLGDILVARGVLTLQERDIVLAFQQNQTLTAESQSKNRLGNILLRAGEITRKQLGDALKLQETSGGRLGNILVKAGYATLKQVTHGLQLQKNIAKAPLVAMSLATLLAAVMPPAAAGQASGNVQVSAYVVAQTKVHMDYQASQLTISKEDVARGFIDVAAASRFSLVSNSRYGFLINLYPVGDIFDALQIKGLDYPAQLGADGGTLVQRGAVVQNKMHELSYRFILKPGVLPGNYPWPLQLSISPV